MSATTDVEALRLIGEELVRLLGLSDDELDEQAFAGLLLIAELAQWRELAHGQELLPSDYKSCSIQ